MEGGGIQQGEFVLQFLHARCGHFEVTVQGQRRGGKYAEINSELKGGANWPFLSQDGSPTFLPRGAETATANCSSCDVNKMISPSQSPPPPALSRLHTLVQTCPVRYSSSILATIPADYVGPKPRLISTACSPSCAASAKRTVERLPVPFNIAPQ